MGAEPLKIPTLARSDHRKNGRTSQVLRRGRAGQFKTAQLTEYHVGAASLAMPRRRGNPKWGSGGQPLQPTPGVATEFEEQVRRLRLTNQTCVSSTELRRWCERNRNRCYIPEWLLKEWGLPVDPDSSS
jgi:hypothetical protein